MYYSQMQCRDGHAKNGNFSPREWEFPWKQNWKALHWQARPTHLWKSIGGGRSKGLNRGHRTDTRAKKTRPHLTLVCKMPENICKGHVSLAGRPTVKQALRRPADALRCWALLATGLKQRRCKRTRTTMLQHGRPARRSQRLHNPLVILLFLDWLCEPSRGKLRDWLHHRHRRVRGARGRRVAVIHSSTTRPAT